MELLILSALVVGLVQCAKIAGLNKRFAPIFAICSSITLVVIYSFTENVPIMWVSIQNGLIAGLSAVGLYSGVKTTLK